MPIYEYLCKKCNNKIEILEKITGNNIHYCSICQEKMERILSSPALHFKGSGFYITDYKKNNKE